jgi:hypothetical protein
VGAIGISRLAVVDASVPLARDRGGISPEENAQLVGTDRHGSTRGLLECPSDDALVRIAGYALRQAADVISAEDAEDRVQITEDLSGRNRIGCHAISLAQGTLR